MSTTLVAGLAMAVSTWFLRVPAADAAVITLASSYVNAGNLGLPLAVYLLDDPVAVVPTLLFQLLVIAPVAFAVLGSRTSAGAGAGAEDLVPADSRLATRLHRVSIDTLRNPIIVGALAGLILNVSPVRASPEHFWSRCG